MSVLYVLLIYPYDICIFGNGMILNTIHTVNKDTTIIILFLLSESYLGFSENTTNTVNSPHVTDVPVS